MKSMLERLMPLLSEDAVVLPYGKNNTIGETSVYKWLPPKYFVSQEQVCIEKYYGSIYPRHLMNID